MAVLSGADSGERDKLKDEDDFLEDASNSLEGNRSPSLKLKASP